MLDIGVQVAAARHDGSVFFDAVYAWGHQDSIGSESYIKLDASPLDSVASVRRIEMSAKHFIPIWSGVVVGKRQASLQIYLWTLPLLRCMYMFDSLSGLHWLALNRTCHLRHAIIDVY